MIRILAALALLATGGCAQMGTAGAILGLQIVDDALGVTKTALDYMGVKERVKLLNAPKPVPESQPDCPRP